MTETKEKRKPRITKLGKPKISAEKFKKEAENDPHFIEMMKRAEKMRKKMKESKEEKK